MQRFTPLWMAACLLSSVVSAHATTPPVTLDGTIKTFVKFEKPVSQLKHGESTITDGQYVLLQKIKLSPEAQQWLTTHINDKYTLPNSSFMTQADLGMNGVPVLNQGIHGTCVTFAVSGALDAIIGHEDHVSQLCSLALGKYLHKQSSNYPSGWEGSWADLVLGQYKKFGAISLAHQKKYLCGGRKNYPKKKTTTGGEMTADKYGLHSENTMKNIQYKWISSYHNAFTEENSNFDRNENIRLAISNGHRVLIGFLLNANRSHNGALGKYRTKYDSWVLSNKIAEDAANGKMNAGHEVIITAYDDNAVITDDEGIQHRGVYTIRNSWGKHAGDRGNYYMSYDYASKLIMDAFEVVAV